LSQLDTRLFIFGISNRTPAVYCARSLSSNQEPFLDISHATGYKSEIREQHLVALASCIGCSALSPLLCFLVLEAMHASHVEEQYALVSSTARFLRSYKKPINTPSTSRFSRYCEYLLSCLEQKSMLIYSLRSIQDSSYYCFHKV
jgi:hypothetical protein